MSGRIPIFNVRFGRLVVLKSVKAHNKSSAFYLCRCDCGREVEVSGQHLLSGHTTSCGCRKAEVLAAGTNTKHRGKFLYPREYKTWKEMRQRCTNPMKWQYKHYGGRGITICERWNDFTLFLNDMGRRPERQTLDRIDVDGNYTPENCKWSTQKEQMANTRKKKAERLWGVA